jgi:catechol 2,3-dioxygenase-like lactoylglutathione lyase family enzyme
MNEATTSQPAQAHATGAAPVAEARSGIQRLHHFAWRCRNAEETRHFYEDLLGLPLVHVIKLDHVPSTGEYCPYVHLFFAMDDGSCIAFFDLGDNQAALPSPNTPAWVNHIALQVADAEKLGAMKKRLSAAGVEVRGVVDHGFVESIYFFDPNGLRVELTRSTVEPAVLEGYAREAHETLARWTARASGGGGAAGASERSGADASDADAACGAPASKDAAAR